MKTDDRRGTRTGRFAGQGGVAVCLSALAIGGVFLPGDAHAACAVPPETKADFHCIDEGFRVFTEETFEGNGRTCATCHRPETNYTIAPEDIKRLNRKERRLVFANNVPGLENRTLVRELASFNTSGGPESDARDPSTFDNDGDPTTSDVPEPGDPVFRNAITLGAMERTSFMNPDVVVGFDGSPSVPPECNTGVTFQLAQIGWGGNGAPGTPRGDPNGDDLIQCRSHHDNEDVNADGSIRAFANGAIAQHATKSLNRIAKTTACPELDIDYPEASCNAPYDFRFATNDELDAMDAFQRWLGRRALSPEEIALNQGGASPSEDNEFDITLLDFADDRLDLSRDHYIAPLAPNTPVFTCQVCHENGGGTPGGFFEGSLGGGSNTNDATQIDDANDDLGLDLVGYALPKDLGGDGAIGSGTGDDDPEDPDGDSAFSFMPVIEATVKKSFFHNGVKKGAIEDAIEFYFSDDFLATRGPLDLDGDGTPDLLFACDENCMRFGGGDVAFPNGDGVEHLGAFLRMLASYYKLRDCERLVSEIKQRISLEVSTDVPLRHCIFNLEDVKRLVRGARLDPKPNQKLVAQAARLIPQLKTAAYTKDKYELDGILSYLAIMKEEIAKFPAPPDPAPVATVAAN